MIKTATGSIDLKELELILQEKLDSEAFGVMGAKINCLLRELNLIIMIQYPETLTPYPKRVFKLLRETVVFLSVSEEYHILIYLIVVGDTQPQLSPLNFAHLNPQPQAAMVFNPSDEALASKPSESLSQELDFPYKPQKLKFWLLKILATGLGLSAFFALIYGLSRPCVIGECKLIPEAANLATKAFELTENNPTIEELQTARQDLLTSLKLLDTIPSWSAYYNQAKDLQAIYQANSFNLNHLSDALSSAKEAFTQKETAPLSLSAWQEIAHLWQEAIALLQKIPPDSRFYNFAHNKLEQYQRNYIVVKNQVTIEEKAIKSLDSAKEAAKLGELRSMAANSLSNWQQVEATWRTAIKRLEAIPLTTSLYPQRQKLVKQYNYHLAQATKQKNREQLANNLYNKAINKAKIAQKLENNNQFYPAKTNWQEAINALQQISKNTFKYTQANTLIKNYNQHLQRVSLKLQTSSDMQKICVADILICNFSITDTIIKIYLTPDYLTEVAQISRQAQVQKNVATKQDLRQHISGLEQNFQTISNNTKMPVEVYNSNNVLMVKYLPK